MWTGSVIVGTIRYMCGGLFPTKREWKQRSRYKIEVQDYELANISLSRKRIHDIKYDRPLITMAQILSLPERPYDASPCKL